MPLRYFDSRYCLATLIDADATLRFFFSLRYMPLFQLPRYACCFFRFLFSFTLLRLLFFAAAFDYAAAAADYAAAIIFARLTLSLRHSFSPIFFSLLVFHFRHADVYAAARRFAFRVSFASRPHLFAAATPLLFSCRCH